MKGQLVFLGTGGSMGVPVVGCQCSVCHSSDSRNKRLRPSVLLKVGKRQFVIDAGPDFRLQALRYGIEHLDGLLLTHAHHDHTAGIDDLRPIYYKRPSPLPVLLSAETAQDVKTRYYYIFPSAEEENFVHRLCLHILPDQDGELFFDGLSLQYVTYWQGGMSVNGFRLGNLAYLSDIRQFSPTIFQHLEGVKYLVVSALRYTASPLHFSVDEAIDFAKQVGAEQVWMTHISHELDHSQANAYLPANMHLAYDGLEIEFE